MAVVRGVPLIAGLRISAIRKAESQNADQEDRTKYQWHAQSFRVV
jgi:hypothetical protein